MFRFILTGYGKLTSSKLLPMTNTHFDFTVKFSAEPIPDKGNIF